MRKIIILLMFLLITGCSVADTPKQISNDINGNLILTGDESVLYRVEFCRIDFCTNNISPKVFKNFFLNAKKVTAKMPNNLYKIAWGKFTHVESSQENYREEGYNFELYNDGYLIFDNEQYQITNMDEIRETYPLFFDLLEKQVKQVKDNFKSDIQDLIQLEVGFYNKYETKFKSEETKQAVLEKIGSIRYIESFLGDMGAGHWGFNIEINDGEPLYIQYGLDNLLLTRDINKMKNYNSEDLYLSIDNFDEVVFGNFDLSIDIPYLDSNTFVHASVYFYENNELTLTRVDDENNISYVNKLTVKDIELMEFDEINRMALDKDFTTIIDQLPTELGKSYTIYIEKIKDGVTYRADFSYEIVTKNN